MWHWLGVYIELIVSSKDGGGLIREDQRRLETSFFRLVFVRGHASEIVWLYRDSFHLNLRQYKFL